MSSADVSTEEIIITEKGTKIKKKKHRANKDNDSQSNKGFAKLIHVKENEVEFQMKKNNNTNNNNTTFVKYNEELENQSVMLKNQDDIHSRVFTFYNQDALETEKNQTLTTTQRENPMTILNQINNELNELSISLQRLILPTNNNNSTTNLSLSLSHPNNKFLEKSYDNDYSSGSVKRKVNSSRLYNHNNSSSQTSFYYNDYY